MLNLDHIRSHAVRRHGKLLDLREKPPLYADPARVGARAERLARMFYKSRFDEEPRASTQATAAAGYLIYAIECYGHSFETLCDIADTRVAWLVSAASPDPRLTPDRRGDELAVRLGNLGAQHPGAQLARLAELQSTCEHVERLPSYRLEGRVTDVSLWATAAVKWLEALHRLDEVEALKTLKHALKKQLKALSRRAQAILDEAARREAAGDDADEEPAEAPTAFPEIPAAISA
jgi:hypothetical protein